MKKSKLFIDGEIFVYEDETEDITYEGILPISIENAKLILSKTKYLFNVIDLPFYLAYGTLLGAIREHGLIPGDEDVDIFIDNEEKLFRNLPFLYQNGFKLCRLSRGIIYSFRVNDKSYIDVYILRPFKLAIWKLNCYSLSGLATPMKYFKGYCSCEFLGETFQCPKNPEKLLEFWYGKNWRTPVAGHEFYYEIKLAYYWHNKIKPFLSPIVKNVIGYKYWKSK